MVVQSLRLSGRVKDTSHCSQDDVRWWCHLSGRIRDTSCCSQDEVR